MLGLFLPNRWRLRPTQSVGINFNHELSRGLKNYFLFTAGNHFKDLARGGIYAHTITGTVTGFREDHWATDNSASNYLTLNLGSTNLRNLDFTLLTGGISTSGSVAWSALNTGIANWTGFYSSSGSNLSIADNNVFDGSVSPAVSFRPQEKWGMLYSAYCVQANNARGARGGEIGVDSAFTTPGTGTLSNVSFGVSLRNVADNATQAYLSHFAVYDRVLPDAALRELSVNPWQVFKQKTAKIYSLPSAAPGGALAWIAA